jgi:hypothetical protein
MVDAEQALEVTAREYMESIVAPLLVVRWQQVHDDMVGDIAWIAIFRARASVAITRNTANVGPV